jgi:DNA-binding transcriptional MerR regulator
VADFPSVIIPDKPAFKAGEVCELAQIQPYVLRSWESEFPDLGLSRTPGGPRVYRRIDVERVLRIRAMVFTEGLTLSGVRRRFEAEQPQPQDDLVAFVAEVQAAQARAAQTRGGQAPGESAPPVTPEVSRPAATPSAGGSDAGASRSVDVPPKGAAVPAEARAQIGKLKADMQSLLDLLGGDEAPSRPAPSAAAAKRMRRG